MSLIPAYKRKIIQIFQDLNTRFPQEVAVDLFNALIVKLIIYFSSKRLKSIRIKEEFLLREGKDFSNMFIS